MSTHSKICAILIDEMSIKERVSYDVSNDNVCSLGTVENPVHGQPCWCVYGSGSHRQMEAVSRLILDEWPNVPRPTKIYSSEGGFIARRKSDL